MMTVTEDIDNFVKLHGNTRDALNIALARLSAIQDVLNSQSWEWEFNPPVQRNDILLTDGGDYSIGYYNDSGYHDYSDRLGAIIAWKEIGYSPSIEDYLIALGITKGN